MEPSVEGERKRGVPATKSYRTRRRTVPEWRCCSPIADKTIRLLFPRTLSINGNVYCSPEGNGKSGPGGGEVTVPLVRSILHDTRALLRFREFFGH